MGYPVLPLEVTRGNTPTFWVKGFWIVQVPFWFWVCWGLLVKLLLLLLLLLHGAPFAAARRGALRARRGAEFRSTS